MYGTVKIMDHITVIGGEEEVIRGVNVGTTTIRLCIL
jgi:hypothetical protein